MAFAPFCKALLLSLDDWQVTVSEVPLPPGHVGQVHHHADFVLAYVLEGNEVTKVSGQRCGKEMVEREASLVVGI